MRAKRCFYTKVSFTVTDYLAQVERQEPPHHTTPCTVKVSEIVLNKVSVKKTLKWLSWLLNGI